jgi:hypothetical protein
VTNERRGAWQKLDSWQQTFHNLPILESVQGYKKVNAKRACWLCIGIIYSAKIGRAGNHESFVPRSARCWEFKSQDCEMCWGFYTHLSEIENSVANALNQILMALRLTCQEFLHGWRIIQIQNRVYIPLLGRSDTVRMSKTRCGNISWKVVWTTAPTNKLCKLVFLTNIFLGYTRIYIHLKQNSMNGRE